jgi:glycosyltransferase involved in cell wall biosynthesis
MRYTFFNAGSWERNPSMMRLRELGRELIARGVDVTYAVDDYEYNRKHLDLDPKANVVFSARPRGLAQWPSRRRTLKTLRSDFVHILNPSPRTCAGLWGSRLRVVGDWDEWPVLRSGPLAHRLIQRYLDHWMRHRPVLTVVASKYMTQQFRRRYGMDSLYLPYATYISKMPTGPSPFDRPTAVSMGAFFTTYDHDILFNAARLLKASGKLPPMTFIGAGPDWQRWRAFVQKHQLDNVELKGYVDDDQRWLCLRNAHVLLFPIRANPINLARCPAKTFAYAQARRPVITNRVGEVPEVFAERATYIDPTPEAFATAIAEVMQRPQPDVDYGLEQHNWSARADTLLAALNSLKHTP